MYLAVISTLFGVGIASATFRFLGRPKVGDKREGRSLWGPYLLVLLPVAAVLTYNSVSPSTVGRTPPTWPVYSSSLSGGILVGYARVRRHEGFFLTGLVIAYAGSLLAALCIAPSTCRTCRSCA